MIVKPPKQTHHNTQLLLKEMQLLQRHPQLHRTLRSDIDGSPNRSNKNTDHQNRSDRLSLHQQNNPTHKTTHINRATDRAQNDLHPTKQHPLRKNLHTQTNTTPNTLQLYNIKQQPQNHLRSTFKTHAERHHHNTNNTNDARVHRHKNHDPHLSHI